MHCEQNDGSLWQDTLQDGSCFDAVQTRHGEVEKDQIGFCATRFFNGVGTINGFAYSKFYPVAFEQEPDRTTHGCAVIRNQHTSRHGGPN